MTNGAASFEPVAMPRFAVLPALVRQESRRLVLHPAFVVGLVLTIVGAVYTTLRAEQSRDVIGSLTSGPTFFTGLLGLFAANLVTTRDRRAGSTEVLTPVPGREHDRTLALIVASLLPAGLTLVVVATFHALYLSRDFYGNIPAPGMLLQAPVTVWGGCLLGIMVGRWAPVRAAPVLFVVGLMAVNIWTEGADPQRRLFGLMTSWLEWSTRSPNRETPFIAGSPTWHLVYLVALCLLAAVAALLRTAPRRRGLLALAVMAASTVVVAGIAQVP
jgi:hypothetical protein